MKMKWYSAFVFIFTMCMILSGCGAIIEGTAPTYAPTGGDLPDMIQVAGKKYVIWGFKSDLIPEENEIAGYIISVSETESVTQDEQANFSAALDQPYAFVDGQLLLYVKGKWLTGDLFD